jgi:Holliday junction DNA helicase RuvB
MPRPPFQIDEFVGQEAALWAVFREQDGARARGEQLPPVMFTGESGSGKSLAARVLAKRAGAEMVKFRGTELLEDIVERLHRMKQGDVAFFDECHQLPAPIQELLYEVIDSNQLPPKLLPNTGGEEPTKLASISLVFATDKPGRCLNALLKRIPTIIRFSLYPVREMKEIVKRVAARSNVLLSPQAAGQLARVCNGLPRRAEHHVRKARLYFADSEKRQLSIGDIQEYLEARGIDPDGLGAEERSYLEFLGKNRSASLEALAAELRVDAEFVRGQVEQPLRYRGLITVRSCGRVLTREGREWIRQQRRSRVTSEGNPEED